MTINEPARNDLPITAKARSEDARISSRMSRRTLLSVAAAASLAGCSSPIVRQKPTPTATRFALDRTATLAADGTVPPSLAQSALPRLTGTAGLSDVALATPGEAADLVLTFGALPDGYIPTSVGASAVTLLTHLRVPIDNVTASQAKALLAGGVTDWSSVGAPASLPSHPFKLSGLPIPDGVSLAASAQSAPDVASLLTALRDAAGKLRARPTRGRRLVAAQPRRGQLVSRPGARQCQCSRVPTIHVDHRRFQSAREAGTCATHAGDRVGAVVASATTTVDMAVVGDIMLGRGVNNQMVSRGDYLFPYRAIHDELQSADLRVANLECTITDLVPVPTDPSTFTFVSSAKAVNGLTYAGFDVLTVANNHSNGPGPEAFLDMLNTLHSHGIKSCGGGHNIGEARTPAIHQVNGTRIAILGYDIIPPQGPFATATATGLAPVDLTTLPDDINAARAQADLVLPYFHWGIEYTKDPTQEQQQIARAAIDAGADMVLGNHPHWTQGIETYKGRLIIYSFGNFIFDQDWSRPTEEGMLLHLYWRGATLASIRFVPVIDVSRCQPRVMTPVEAQDLFDRMWSGTDLLASGHYGPEPE